MSFEKVTTSGFFVRKKLAVLFLFSSVAVFAQQGKEINGKDRAEQIGGERSKPAADPNVQRFTLGPV